MITRKKSGPSSSTKATRIDMRPHAPDVAVKPRTWTRAQAEAHIRSLNMRCQGPRNATEFGRWQRLMAAGKEAEARAVITRDGCGYDFGQTVVKHPFDGAEHESTCPKCGTATSWRSPVFDGLNETKKGGNK